MKLPFTSIDLSACPQSAQDALAKYAEEAAELFRSGAYFRAMLKLDQAHAVAHLLAHSLAEHNSPEAAVAAVKKDIEYSPGCTVSLLFLNKFYAENRAYNLRDTKLA